MGYPMAENLIKKLPPSVKLYVFDVAKDVVETIAASHKDRVYSCSDSKEVAEKSVRIACSQKWQQEF